MKKSNLTTALQRASEPGEAENAPVAVNAKTAQLLRKSPEYRQVALAAPEVSAEVKVATAAKTGKP